ncbi:hypothetical protein [uncultured Shewanella sp.]|uniref:hypothetical protein n=1 Tax=uncultured Shewanella sp. TaxID=173975 RepID=UPI0026171719|nr:hypothetical protein [uncultured Shewanella sp.]
MDPTKLVFFKLVAQKIELPAFETWVYTESKLEETLTSDDYLALISINYTTPSALYEAKKILSLYFSMGQYYEWYLRNILQKIVNRPSDVQQYIRQCYELYCDGFDFMDNLGMGYGLSATCPDYYNETVDDYYPQILGAVDLS